jgi:DNA replication protein DnaC
MSTRVRTIDEILKRIRQLQVSASVGYARETAKAQCHKCQDLEGFIVRKKDGSEVWRWCECHEEKRRERLFQYSRLSDECKQLTFQNFSLLHRPQAVQEAYECAFAYVEEFQIIESTRKNSIALLGRSGSGKTHLLMAIANELLRQGVAVHYFPWVEGLNHLKSSFDMLNEKLEHLKRIRVLFIDDLFKGRKTVTDFQLELLFEIVNSRYLHHMPILVSSEKDIDEICEIDEGIGSRIYEMVKDFTVVLRGERELNYRLWELV